MSISVVLPAPFGPSTVRISVGSTPIEMSRATVICPYPTCRFSHPNSTSSSAPVDRSATVAATGAMAGSTMALSRCVEVASVRERRAEVGLGDTGVRADLLGGPDAMTVPKSRTWMESQRPSTSPMS